MATHDRFWLDKCVLITGASSGIGAALARHVAERGARVGLMARREPLLSALADELNRPPAKAAFAVADVCDASAVATAVRSLEATLGPCDVAVAAAGIYRQTSGKKFTAEAASSVMATNFLGVTNLLAAVLPGMVARGSGNIAAVGSVAGMIGMPAAGAYCASKGAVVKLLQSLRVDLAPCGIKVTAVCPGFVDTAMVTDEERQTLKHLVSAPDAAHRIAWAIATGRPEHWFPWQTWLEAKLASLLPHWIFERVMSAYGEMEET